MRIAYKAFFTLTALFLCTHSPSIAMEKDGITLPDSITVDGKPLVLNGMGTRTAMLGIKVYVAGLYLPQKTTETQKVLDLAGPKEMNLHFKMEVKKEKIQTTLEESFHNNCEGKCDPVRPQLDALKALLGDVKKGDVLTYSFAGDTVSVSINGQNRGKVEGKLFSKTLLSTWIGKNPPSEGLKKGLLGVKE